jgi:hypothetical protein
MAERAQVSSIESIDFFRSRLILYAGKARAAAEEVLDEVRRTRVWLESSQRSHWETECRRRKRILEDAEQALFSAKLSQWRTQTAAQIMAVERARQSFQQAEEKRAAVRRWTREFDLRAEPLAKEVEPLLSFITTDVPKAVVYLGNVVKALQVYAAADGGGIPNPHPAQPGPLPAATPSGDTPARPTNDEETSP